MTPTQWITGAAPNFSGDYPLAGALIGPAWQAAWTALTDAPELTARTLTQVMCDASPIQAKTAENVLRSARKAGCLARHRRKLHGKTVISYSVNREWRDA